MRCGDGMAQCCPARRAEERPKDEAVRGGGPSQAFGGQEIDGPRPGLWAHRVAQQLPGMFPSGPIAASLCANWDDDRRPPSLKRCNSGLRCAQCMTSARRRSFYQGPSRGPPITSCVGAAPVQLVGSRGGTPKPQWRSIRPLWRFASQGAAAGMGWRKTRGAHTPKVKRENRQQRKLLIAENAPGHSQNTVHSTYDGPESGVAG